MQDTYSPTPQGTYDERRRLYLEFCAADNTGGRTGLFSQIGRLELGRDPVDETAIREGIAYVYSQQDCNDFTLGALLRIVYGYRHSPLIPPELIGEIETCLRKFKYWWDQPGADRRCYHTENHQIIFHSDELLAGQLFRDQLFEVSGKDGQFHVDHALHLIRRWFDFRERFGFSEWLSNCYFEEDLLALVNLYDFAEDADIRRRAGNMIDVILFEMALHTYRGVFGSSHGRSYPRLIKGGRGEDSASTAKLMFGMGIFNKPSALGAVPLATSSYRCPAVIPLIAADLDGPRLMCERHSLNIEDAPAHGLSYTDMEDGYLYWSIQDYTHPAIIELAQQTRRTFGVMLYEDYQPRYDQLAAWAETDPHVQAEPSIDCHAMTEVHVQTYRTPHYMLSCAQDYRPGKPGYQQHPWQATLGIDAVVFTNHPGAEDEISRPNFWGGNGVLPKAVQHRNVLIAMHHVPADDAFPYSHSYFPRAAFDEVVERGHWICAAKDGGYLAFYSQHPTQWRADAAGNEVELRVDLPDNIWLCELGSVDEWGSFAAFVEAVIAAEIECDDLSVVYRSPSVGTMELSWNGPLRVDGAEVEIHNYPRFDNPYCHAEFGAKAYEITHAGQHHRIDL
jgi:hypothetical protein